MNYHKTPPPSPSSSMGRGLRGTPKLSFEDFYLTLGNGRR
jgi:hypothetical protein